MDWTGRVRAAFHANAISPEVIDELADHARDVYDAARRDGLSHGDAVHLVSAEIARWPLDTAGLRRRPARLPAPLPPASSSSLTRDALHDLRYASRLLRRHGRESLLAILTIALGIAGVTVLFSVVYSVLIRPLPWPNANRVVEISETRGGHAPRFGSVSNAALWTWQQNATTVDHVAAWSEENVTLESPGEPAERVRLTAASAGIFPTLGIQPTLGSLFEQTDEAAPVIVLSEDLWRRRFRANPNIIGMSATIDGRPRTIVAVVSSDVAFPDRQSQGWIPFRVEPVSGNALSMFDAVALLRPGATPAQAAAEGTARGRFAPDTGMTTRAIFGGTGPVAITTTPLDVTVTAEVRRPLWLLLAAVGLLLLAATANVASLQFARAVARQHEMAIRAAIGADGRRIVRQLVAEHLLVGVGGGLAGLSAARVVLRALPSILPVDFPRASEIALGPPVMASVFALALLVGTVCGILPAMFLRRSSLVARLTENGTAPAWATIHLRGGRLRFGMMAGQIAIACVLLVGASLLARSFWTLTRIDRGYDPANLVTATLSLPAPRYAAERRYALVDDILARLATSTETKTVALTTELPLTAGGSTAAMTLRSPILVGPTPVQASPRVVSQNYFSTMRMRIITGRSFDDADGPTSEPVAIVNRAFARQYLGASPLDTRVPMGVGYMTADTDAAVVGVVDDVHYVGTGQAARPEVYYLYRQLRNRLSASVVTFLVRTPDMPSEIASTMRRAIREADSALVPDRVTTMDDRVGGLVARPRFYAELLAMFAVSALAITAVGLFATLSHAVGQRSRELALRAALGARPSALAGLILAQGLAVALAGLCVGLLVSFAFTSAIRSLLYGIPPHDAFTFIAVPIVVVGVSLVAGIGPASRAAKLDPIKELRS